jgi:hypothetical protein
MSSTSAHVDGENKTTIRAHSDIATEEKTPSSSSTSEPLEHLSTNDASNFESLSDLGQSPSGRKPQKLTWSKAIRIKSVLALVTFILLVISSLLFALKGDHETSQKIITLLTAQVIPALNASFFNNCTNAFRGSQCQKEKW